MSFRYRCLKCVNVDVCQVRVLKLITMHTWNLIMMKVLCISENAKSCFWTQKSNRTHKLTHPTKEYCMTVRKNHCNYGTWFSSVLLFYPYRLQLVMMWRIWPYSWRINSLESIDGSHQRKLTIPISLKIWQRTGTALVVNNCPFALCYRKFVYQGADVRVFKCAQQSTEPIGKVKIVISYLISLYITFYRLRELEQEPAVEHEREWWLIDFVIIMLP